MKSVPSMTSLNWSGILGEPREKKGDARYAHAKVRQICSAFPLGNDALNPVGRAKAGSPIAWESPYCLGRKDLAARSSGGMPDPVPQ